MKGKAISALLVAALTVGMLSTGAAQDATESANYSVTIDSTTAIDVQPTALNYSNIEVGSQTTQSSDAGYTAVELENIGSEYIDTAWINSTIPTSAPFGSGSAANYDAGNFIQIRPANDTGILQGDTDDFHHVNRIEYMESASSGDVPSYIQWDGNYNGNDPGAHYVGRFRMGSEERFFVIADVNDNGCDGTDNDPIRVAEVSRSDTQRGTIDFTDSGSDYKEYNITTPGAGDYGVTDSGPSNSINGVVLRKDKGTANEVNRTYDALTRCSPSSGSPHVIRTRYNIDAAGTSDMTSSGVASEYLINAANEDRALAPGQSVTLETAIEVPNGVAQGSVSEGTLRVLVTSDTTFDTS